MLTSLVDNIYKETWRTLAICFGERMQDEELELMDAILSGVKLGLEERQDENAISEPNDRCYRS